jgi:hypothetical protein
LSRSARPGLVNADSVRVYLEFLNVNEHLTAARFEAPETAV